MAAGGSGGSGEADGGVPTTDGATLEANERRPRWHTWQVVVAVLAVALLAAAVSFVAGRSSKDDEAEQQVSTETSTSVSGSASTTVTSVPPAPSAAAQLAPYVSAAREVDAQLKAAADRINGAVSPDHVVVDQQTVDAIRAIDTVAPQAAIPFGMPPDLTLAAVVVQSDLVSRQSALGAFTRMVVSTDPLPVTLPTTDLGVQDSLACLRNGREAAAQFEHDVADLQRAATATPPFDVAAPDSHAAAELAIWLAEVHEGNTGCDSCGGYRLTQLDPVTWHTVPIPDTGGDWDGDVGDILFRATYAPASNWTIQLNAC